MKIYTKTGDKGQTSLLGGTRVSKSHDRLHAYGTIDELNSYIGLLADLEVNMKRKDLLHGIQNILFSLGSSLATEKESLKKQNIAESDITLLEKEIDSMEESLPPLKNFILPGGHTSVSFCHIARCVCRRAERHTIALRENIEVDDLIIQYLNRLSDYLFVLGRMMGKELDAEEIIWKGK
ncbi:MAG: cob(I)yrinic acid a,c-diamide adenosyltransferase [Cytophagaceae bacterium]|nr:cob(I)yrinic acid a,c-diamide adenosyltransferase [Cytophagaceae bacterium]